VYFDIANYGHLVTVMNREAKGREYFLLTDRQMEALIRPDGRLYANGWTKPPRHILKEWFGISDERLRINYKDVSIEIFDSPYGFEIYSKAKCPAKRTRVITGGTAGQGNEILYGGLEGFAKANEKLWSYRGRLTNVSGFAEGHAEQKSVKMSTPDRNLRPTVVEESLAIITENARDAAIIKRQKESRASGTTPLVVFHLSAWEASLAQNALAQAGMHARVEDNTRFINAAAWMGGHKSFDIRSERESFTDQADVVREMDNHLATASRSSHTESDTNGSQHKPDWSQLLNEAPSGNMSTSQPEAREVFVDESDTTPTPIFITDSVIV
jgi:hypothetical protein